jgi:hypothetical protein
MGNDCTVGIMRLPSEPVVLSPDQVSDLNAKLSKLRHDSNNHLTLMSTALELIRRNPGSAERLIGTLAEQPQKIQRELAWFTGEFEAALGIEREPPEALGGPVREGSGG